MSHEVRGNCGVEIGNGLDPFLLSHREGGTINKNFFQSNGRGLSGNEAVCQVRANQGPWRRIGPSIDCRASCVWLRLCIIYTPCARQLSLMLHRLDRRGPQMSTSEREAGQMKLRWRGRAWHGLLATPPLQIAWWKYNLSGSALWCPDRRTHTFWIDVRCGKSTNALKAVQRHNKHLFKKKKKTSATTFFLLYFS